MSVERHPPYHLTLCMVNYNGERYLEESLGSVFTQKERFEEILLIDNASNDRGLEIVRNRFPTVKVIQLSKNLGPAAARNAGFKASSCNLILFMDNDISLAPDCPDRLIEALNGNPRAAVAMPRVLYTKNRDIIQYDGADSHFLGLMTLHNVNRPLSTSTGEIRKIGSLVTACFLIDRKRWGRGDPFDETFFFNYEDHDFGLRTRTLGHEILSVPSAICYHREGTEGLSLREGGDRSRVRVFCLIRNRWQLILKNYEFKTLLLLSPAFFIYEVFQLIGVIEKGWFREWLRALLWIIRNPLLILQKRRIVQKERRIRDREILSDGPIPFTGDFTKGPLERIGKGCLDFLVTTYWRRIERFI